MKEISLFIGLVIFALLSLCGFVMYWRERRRIIRLSDSAAKQAIKNAEKEAAEDNERAREIAWHDLDAAHRDAVERLNNDRVSLGDRLASLGAGKTDRD